MKLFSKDTRRTSRKVKPVGRLTALGHRAGDVGLPLPEKVTDLIEDGFPLIDGPNYHDVLAELHLRLAPDWYLEIGTNEGNSLAYVPGNFVSIDPDFIFENFSMKSQGQGHFLQQTSDDFFESGFLARNGISPNLGFLDGMHQFEFLLRDFMNFEAAAAPNAMAVLHDCLPFNHAMEAREWDRDATGFWTGDVWKTLAILLRERPDLTIDVLDAFPTGLVAIRNLDSKNGLLSERYDALIAEFGACDLRSYGVERFYSSFEIQSSFRFVTESLSPGHTG